MMNNLNKELILGRDKDTDLYVSLDKSSRMNNLLVLGSELNQKLNLTIKPLINQDIVSGSGVIIIEPNDDLVYDVISMAQYHKRDYVYFNPADINKTYRFNPLSGDSRIVSKVLVNSFQNSIPELKKKLVNLDLGELFDNALEVLDYCFDEANLRDLYYLLSNCDLMGEEILFEYMKKITSTEWSRVSYNNFNKAISIVNYFKNYYIIKNDNFALNKIDSELENLLNNDFVKESFVLERNQINKVSFDYALNNNTVMVISTAKKHLKDSHELISELIMNNLSLAIINSSYCKVRVPKTIYINNAELYLNESYTDVLKSNRLYNVNSIVSMNDSSPCGFKNINNALYLDVMGNLRNIIISKGVTEYEAIRYADFINSKFKSKNINYEEILNLENSTGLALLIRNHQYVEPKFIELLPLDEKIKEICRINRKNFSN